MVGNQLKTIRKIRGLTQEGLAEKAGVHFNTIARWERGEIEPRGKSLAKLADALHTTVAYLRGETDNPEPEPKENLQMSLSNIRPVRGQTIAVPVLGPQSSLCCGLGCDIQDVDEEVEWYEPVLESWLTGPKGDRPYYITHVDGDSMEPLIQDGERILVNPNQEVRTGDVAVVCWKNRSMVKGVIFERNGNIRLVPVNKNYPEIFIAKDDAPYDVRFGGVVIHYLGLDRPARGFL